MSAPVPFILLLQSSATSIKCCNCQAFTGKYATLRISYERLKMSKPESAINTIFFPVMVCEGGPSRELAFKTQQNG